MLRNELWRTKSIHNFLDGFPLHLQLQRWTVLLVSFRDSIFSFVGRRLYLKFPTSSNLLSVGSKTSSCLEKEQQRLVIGARRKKYHIHFHRYSRYGWDSVKEFFRKSLKFFLEEFFYLAKLFMVIFMVKILSKNNQDLNEKLDQFIDRV